MVRKAGIDRQTEAGDMDYSKIPLETLQAALEKMREAQGDADAGAPTRLARLFIGRGQSDDPEEIRAHRLSAALHSSRRSRLRGGTEVIFHKGTSRAFGVKNPRRRVMPRKWGPPRFPLVLCRRMRDCGVCVRRRTRRFKPTADVNLRVRFSAIVTCASGIGSLCFPLQNS